MKYLFDTKDKDVTYSNSASDCRIDLRKGHHLKAGKYMLHSLIVPFYDYHVVANQNDKVYYVDTDSTATHTVTIPEGYYTGSTLASVLKVIMDLESTTPTFAVTYDTTTKKITVIPSVGSLGFKFGSNTTQSASTILGYANTDVTGDSTTGVTGDYPIQLDRTAYLKLDMGGNDISDVTGSRNPFSTLVPVDRHETTVFMYGLSAPLQSITITEENIITINIQLRYPDNKLVNMRGRNISFILESSC